MSVTATLLSNEQALTQRILLAKSVPAEFWQWLADQRSPTVLIPPAWSQPELSCILAEIIDPLLADAKPYERSRHAQVAEMIGAMLRFIALTAESQHWTFANRLMASNLMPLYRCLATGDLEEALQQTRLALCESLALVGLANELGSDFSQLVLRDPWFGQAPHECLQMVLNVQLSRLARIMVFAGERWDHENQTQLTELVACAEFNSRLSRAALWASPAAMWRLAGELMSKKAEFVMPREWINVPVPWSSVSEHWSSLEHLLTTASSQKCVATESFKNCEFDRSDTQSSHPVRLSESVEGMIMLGEVRSHNDPVFTNLVSRQLATCRSEDRSICLLAIHVEPEEEQDRQQLSASCDNGLFLWQQKLVNWLADQPEVQEPYAFTCTDGELILCLLDIERNSATSLLRQGLVEVLTGKRLVDEAFVSLARVHIPARYHVGIASVSCPGASFAAEQLIAATYRCLEAAQRHGKAAIKSIEVY